jgi:aminopeptidase N
MMTRFRATLLSRLCRFTTCLLLSAALAHSEEISCTHGKMAPPPQVLPGSGVRRYAPDRQADLLKLKLDVTPDFAQRSLTGIVTLTFKPIAKPLEELSLDAIDFTVTAVESTSPLKGQQATREQVILTFSKPLPVGVEQQVTIHYRATPQDGLYFRTPEQGYPIGESHLFTQGETILARHWFPVLDSPNEKLSTEVICRLPDGMQAFSNGKLISQVKDATSGLTAYDWQQEKPHSAYLVSLVAGQFTVIEDRYKDLPMAFIVPPADAAMAQRSLDGTKEMLAFFERELGFPFAWDKYHQIVVRDFQWGGMENTSLTTLTDRTLHTGEYENLRSSTSLVAHELAHQWFGDVITCKDWSHLWLNEGFATYYDDLYHEQLLGHDHFLYERQKSADMLTQQNNPRPIVFREIAPDAYDQFGNLSYEKGSWILHMLRCELGPDLYRQTIQTYLKRHAFQNVTTAEFIAVLEETTGRSYDRFFDQWVYHGGTPSLAVDYSWDEKNGLARIGIRQTQKITAELLQYQLPVTVRFKGDFGTIDHLCRLDDLAQDFYCKLPSAPKIVRIDPEVTLLAAIDFTPPREMLNAQLADPSDSIGRVFALRHLATGANADGIERIKKTLNTDPQWFVRVEAAMALAKVDTDPALDALRASTTQPDARARRATITALGSYLKPSAEDALLTLLPLEKNPDIREAILRALPRHPGTKSHAELLAALSSQSLREHLFEAAVQGLRAADDESHIPPLLAAIRSRQATLESRPLAAALTTLGYLARNRSDKTEVFDLLAQNLNSLRDPVAKGATTGLGLLADPRARPLLLALTSKPHPEIATAALVDLDQGSKPPAALGAIQKELAELRKTHTELKQSLDTLKKRLDPTPAKSRAK